MSKVVKLKSDEQPSPSEFRIPASDTKGHSARHWFRCIPAMARQVEQVVQSKQFPYRTKGDLLRHALHRHMKWLATQSNIPSVAGQVDTIIELMKDEEMSNDFTLVFEKLGERINMYQEEGSDGEAMRLVSIIQRHVEEMPTGFWKSKYTKELKKRYGKLIRAAKKANLGDLE